MVYLQIVKLQINLLSPEVHGNLNINVKNSLSMVKNRWDVNIFPSNNADIELHEQLDTGLVTDITFLCITEHQQIKKCI